MNTKKLIQLIINKNEIAFEYVYDTYYRLVYYVIHQKVANKDDVIELVQDTFLAIYNNIESFQGKNFKYWILQIAKNKANNFVTREMSKRKKVLLNNELVDHAKNNYTNDNKYDALIYQNFPKLTGDILIMKIVHDFTFDEIASELNIDRNKVYRIYKSSLGTLKLIMEVSM